MSKEKQIEKITKVLCDACVKRNKKHGGRCKDISGCSCSLDAKAIYAAGYRKTEWISVDERLPEECKNVLCVEGNKMMIAFMEKVEDCGTFVPVFWDFVAYDRDDTWNEVCATHWMPLPEPPMMKGGAE